MNEYSVFNGYTVVQMIEKKDHAAALQTEREKHAAEVAAKDAEIERLRKDNSGLHEIQDLQREHIVERDRRIAVLEKERAEARALSDEQYQFALATQTENESLRAQLAAVNAALEAAGKETV